MRAVGYSRCLLCSALAVLMLTALMLAVLPAVSLALEPGVHADPGSPAEKQYVLPLSQARGTGGETSSHSSSPRLFGAGIKPPGGGGNTGAGSRSSTQAGSGAPAGKGNHRHTSGARGVRSTGAPAGGAAPLPDAILRASRSQGSSGNGSLFALIGGGLAILVVGAFGGTVLRHSRRPTPSS